MCDVVLWGHDTDETIIPRLSFCLSLSKWAEYVLFASLLVVVCFIFSIMAHFYTYMDPAEIEAQFTKKVDEDDEDDKHQLQKEQLEMVKKHSTHEDEDDTAKRTRMWTLISDV